MKTQCLSLILSSFAAFAADQAPPPATPAPPPAAPVKRSAADLEIQIQPANPQVVYVPTYNPAVVYYPPPPAVSFAAGVAVGAIIANNCDWHYGGCYHGDVNIDIDRNVNVNRNANGNTGIMTFIVNQQGRVYQKDLGPKTARTAAAMKYYDPDKTWTISPN